MRNGREDRLISTIKRLAAEFLGRQLRIGNGALLTVSRVGLSSDGKRATIYLTVFPDAAEGKGLEAGRRQLGPLRELLKMRLGLKHPPYLIMALDEQEKNDG